MKLDTDFSNFVVLHQPQLISSGVPQLFWNNLFEKLTSETFDSGNTFLLTQFEYDHDDGEDGYTYEPKFQLQIKVNDGISSKDPSQIYLVDHAWTFRVDQAKQVLSDCDSLLQRMTNILGINSNLPKLELLDKVFNEMWRFANTYSMANAENVEDRMPVWYIMDEVGSAMRHSNDANFRMVPFYYIPQNITYSLIFPVKDCEFGEIVARNFCETDVDVDSDERKAMLIPWVPVDFTKKSFQHIKVAPEYFLGGHIKESLPVLDNLRSNECSSLKPLNVFTQYKFIHQYLTDEHFELVDNEDEADILWITSHFKQFEDLSIKSPRKYVNQFPFEYILTIKDLLCIVCRIGLGQELDVDMQTLAVPPKWLPVTYNLKTELPQFVSYFQNRDLKGLDNHWIIKPFNLARGLDTHITNNINYILRLPSSGPKIAQKYIDKPVLFERPGIGKVKFDIRYVILLKSVKPLQVYVYKNFFLRFANQPFSLSDLHVYEKHFTVMNYNEQAELKHLLCAEFKEQWEGLFSKSWETVEMSITSMLREVFVSATTEPSPCGISESPQSRALYAADIMLEYIQEGEEMCPKLLEINWMPDCKRACEYYPDFYNDIFKLLFLDIDNETVFRKL